MGEAGLVSGGSFAGKSLGSGAFGSSGCGSAGREQPDPTGTCRTPKMRVQTLSTRIGVSPGAGGTRPCSSASSCASSLWKTTGQQKFWHSSRAQKQRDLGGIPGILGVPWLPGSAQGLWPCLHGVWPPALPSAAPAAAPGAPAPSRYPGRDLGLGAAVEGQGAALGTQGSRRVAAQGLPHPSPEPPEAESQPRRSASRSGRTPASAPGSAGKGELGKR